MKVSSNKITDVFRYYLKLLNENYDLAEAKSLIYRLLEHYFNISRLDIAKDPDIRLTESELLKIHFSVKDLLNNKPIQHIIGIEQFCGLNFKVSKAVLIPRPETEELVEMIVDDCKDTDQKISILDIGTGSGCIAISLNKKISNSIVHAVDISADALQIAKENAEINVTEVVFSRINVLNMNEIVSLPMFDVIVSNPPYIRCSEKKLMHKNVLDYDPESALFVSDDAPLIFYRKIAVLGLTHLNINGKIYFEINEIFGNDIADLLVSNNYSNIKIHKDFRGKDRFVSAILSKK